MELRKAEQEVENLSFEWKTIRRKRPRILEVNQSYDAARYGNPEGIDNGEEHNSHGWGSPSELPSWRDLLSRLDDKDIFPPQNEKDTCEGSGPDSNNSNNDNKSNNNNVGTERKNGGSKGEDKISPAAEKKIVVKSQCLADIGGENSDLQDDIEGEDASPQEILALLESLRESVSALQTKMDRFLARLTETDPVTGKSRYGEKTKTRVKNVILSYKALELGLEIAFDNPSSRSSSAVKTSSQSFANSSATPTVPMSIVSALRCQIKQHDERVATEAEHLQSLQHEQHQRLQNERALAEKHEQQRRLADEKAKRDHEQELARLAEESRQRRLQEERLALEAERQADRDFVASVTTLGVDGIREQIGRMREALKNDKAALDVALGSLYTLFDQIVRKPEEANFRRIRRDHPKFMEDIGRHAGGREVLIAAGFRLDKLDGVPCFFSREPNIESDMDGWSNWFDGLKKTLEVIEEEMIK